MAPPTAACINGQCGHLPANHDWAEHRDDGLPIPSDYVCLICECRTDLRTALHNFDRRHPGLGLTT